MISIQTTESTQGSRFYPQEWGLGEKNPIFTYPQKKSEEAATSSLIETR